MSFESLLDRTAVIQGRTVTASFGSDTVSYPVVIASYPCRIYNVTPRKTRREGGEEVMIVTRAAGAVNALIVAGCLLIEGGTTYEILGVNPVHDESESHHVEMDLELKSA